MLKGVPGLDVMPLTQKHSHALDLYTLKTVTCHNLWYIDKTYLKGPGSALRKYSKGFLFVDSLFGPGFWSRTLEELVGTERAPVKLRSFYLIK